MAITTKQTLSNKKFRQSTHDELNLNGKVIIGGELSLNDGNHGVGKIITSDENGKFIWSETGIPNGVATLDENGLVPSSQLPSYVDDVLEFDNFASLPTTGETGKIYVTRDTNSTYRWSGSQYIKVNDAVSTSETATKLATARNIQATGDATWQVTFDGSKNVTAALTLVNTGVVPNSYGNNITIPALTIDSKGRITSISTNTVRSATQSVSGVMSAADKTKLDGIATGANNYTHPNHTGDVTSNGDGATVISNDSVTNAKLANMGASTIKGRITTAGDPQDLTATQVRSLLNVADGANNYTHPSTHLPSIITQDANNRFVSDSEKALWNAKGSSNLELGETSTTAYRGDRGKTAYDHSQAAHAPVNAQKNSDITKGEIEAKLTGVISTHSHTVTKANVGLGNVDNTSDLDKPISTDTQTALNTKVDNSRVLTDVPVGAKFTDTVYTHPNHTGDVTSNRDGATVITNDSVTNAKLSNMSANTIKGRLNSSGDPQDLTVAQVRSLLNVANGAEVNVQSDWNQTSTTADDYIKNKPSLAEVATTGSYYDLIDVPEYYTYVVHNITEFVEATQTLSGSSGTILLANNITLTSNLTNINLQNIKVDGNGNAINFYNQGNFYYLHTNSSKITFDNVVLRGGFETSFGGEKILEFGSSGYFMFNNVTFRDVSKFSNDLNQTFPTIIQFNSNANLFLVQCRYSGYNTNNNTVNSTIYPLIFNFTPSSGSDGYLHIYLNDFRNVLNQTYVGFTGNFANSSDRYIRYNDLTRDVSVNILTGASYLDFNSLGSEFVYGDNNYTHPNHTGDVTSDGDGATVIANDAVTNVKLANMSASTIKGRLTGSGDPQDLTAAQVRSLLNVADGANNYTHPNHTGDVTSSGGGATVIANDVVTNAKLANMSANTIKGRLTSSGDPQDLTATQIRSLLNVADGANNYTHPNHTGDVTSSGGGATVITNNSVTNAKLADMSANTIKGRLNSSGDPQNLTVAQVKTLLSLKSISEKDYWFGAQATYDAISTKNTNTIYFIPEP